MSGETTRFSRDGHVTVPAGPMTRDEAIQQVGVRPLAVEGPIVFLLAATVYATVIGLPIMTFFSVSERDADTGLFIRVHALAYGVPLVAATVLRLGFSRVPILSTWLHRLAAVMAIYWLAQSVAGYLAGHQVRYWLSTSFNFLVPSMAFLCTVDLRPESRAALAVTIRRAVIVSLAISMTVAYYSLLPGGILGIGGISDLLPVIEGLVLFEQGKLGVGVLLTASGIAISILSMKRVVWGMLGLLPLVYLVVMRTQLGKVTKVLAAIVVASGLGWYAYLSMTPRSGLEMFTDRVADVSRLTDQFTTAQAREDEVRSIWISVAEEGGLWPTLFGGGMGATYTYYMDRTYGLLEREHHDAHFTPAGWFLRGGTIGVAINTLFYTLLLALILRKRSPDVWHGPYTTYITLAVIASISSFSLTPSPITHIMAGMCVGAVRAPFRKGHW